MSAYTEGFTIGYDEVLGIALRPMWAPYAEDSKEHDDYVSGYYDGYKEAVLARSNPN